VSYKAADGYRATVVICLVLGCLLLLISIVELSTKYFEFLSVTITLKIYIVYETML